MTKHTELPPIASKLANARGWDDFTRTLMLAGKRLVPLDEALRDETTLVPGCESPVWLDFSDGAFSAYSPSKVIRGVLAVLLEKANELSPEMRSQFNYDEYLEQCQLDRYLSQSRGNGIKTVILKLKR
ncbi:SufE family protein [Alteromonas gracilis]|uniref:SufE family protein n=1 Tax=Alteromonas gracilis TaxID=1479524 RepID=UPI0030D588B4